jgi:hypothetical protein
MMPFNMNLDILYLHSHSHHNSWKWLETNPMTMVYVTLMTKLGTFDGIKWILMTINNLQDKINFF